MANSTIHSSTSMENSSIVVGIDPQIKLFAVNIRQGNQIIAWFQVFLQKHCRFENAQYWQEYVWKESVYLLDRIQIHLKQIFQKNDIKPNLVVIEQQKGRCQSIIEQCLFVACLQRKWPVKIMHPMTWKTKNGFKCQYKHRANKKKAQEMVTPFLKQWMETKNLEREPISIIPEGVEVEEKDLQRTHDLCDAYLISNAGSLSIGSSNFS